MLKKSLLISAVILLLAGAALFCGCTTTQVSMTATTTATADINCDSRAISISQGHEVEGQIAPGTGHTCYCLQVPAGSSELAIRLYDFAGDFDLWVGYGSYESVTSPNYDWGSAIIGDDPESLNMANPQAGCYYIVVSDFGGSGGSYKLYTEVSGGGPATTTAVTTDAGGCDYRASTISLNTEVDGQFTQGTDILDYCFNVPAGTTRFSVTIYDFTEDYDLFLGYGCFDSVQFPNFDWASLNIGYGESESITINNVLPCNYYIQLVDYWGAGGSFKMNVFAE